MIMATSLRRLSVKPDRWTRFSVPRHSFSVCSRWDGEYTQAENTAFRFPLVHSRSNKCSRVRSHKHSLLVCVSCVCCSCSTNCCRIRVPTWTEHRLTWVASRSWPAASLSPSAWIRSRRERLWPHYTSKAMNAVRCVVLTDTCQCWVFNILDRLDIFVFKN